VATRNESALTASGASKVGAQLGVDGALDRQGRPGEQPEQRPAAAGARQEARRRTLRLGAHDQRRAGQHRHGAGELRDPKRVGLHAQPAEAVERQRREHLARDPEPHRHQCAEPREQQDPRGDVEGAAQPAGELPGLRLAEQVERAERPTQRGEQQQQPGADPQLQRGGAERARHRGRELDVRRGL